MDLVRLGLVIRALRRRRSWRQADLAAAAGVSQSLISLVERGHGDRVPLATLLRIAGGLDARVVVDLRWRGGELERLLDEDHARLTATVTRWLRDAGWEVRVEVTYAVYRASGSIDVLAWHAPTSLILVIEIKTEITSSEATIRKLDEKVRLAATFARERFGWRAASVSRLLVVEDTRTARRRVAVHAELFDATFPGRTVAARRWVARPTGGFSGLLFLAPSTGRGGMSGSGGRHRVRQRNGEAQRGTTVAVERVGEVVDASRGPRILRATTLRHEDC